MKNIKSLKVAAQAFTLRNLIHLYKMCHSGSHEVIFIQRKQCAKSKA